MLETWAPSQEWVSPEPLGWGVGWQVLSRVWVPDTGSCSGHEEVVGRQLDLWS